MGSFGDAIDPNHDYCWGLHGCVTNQRVCSSESLDPFSSLRSQPNPLDFVLCEKTRNANQPYSVGGLYSCRSFHSWSFSRSLRHCRGFTSILSNCNGGHWVDLVHVSIKT